MSVALECVLGCVREVYRPADLLGRVDGGGLVDARALQMEVVIRSQVVDDDGRTLFRAEQRDFAPDSAAGRPYGLYGNRFAAASADMVRAQYANR